MPRDRFETGRPKGMQMTLRRFKFFWPLLLVLAAACASQPDISVEVLPHYDALFQREEGWTGADGAYSLVFAQNTILWLFGDTWIGQVREGEHRNATIVNNSIGIQEGRQPPAASLNFYYRQTPDGKPAAFIQPAEDRSWFWIYHGIRNSQGLYLFLVQIGRTAGEADFGFAVIGNWLAHIPNPQDPPGRWRVRQSKIPWSQFSSAGDTLFGSALLRDDGFVYVYGTRDEKLKGALTKHMIVARVPEAMLGDFDQWRFFAAGRWVADYSKAATLCSNIANEYSVSFQTALRQYIVVYSENGFSENVVARLAPDPCGPWSDPIRLYQCPEADWHKDIICYAAKGHPELSLSADELIITYIANSTDFYRMAGDARLYRPRFVRVRFAVPGPD